MQQLTKINNLSDVIPSMESIPCPDCGNHVTISAHPNSHYISGMDDCLYHGQCRNIACQNCSEKKKVFLICIGCQVTNNNRSLMVQQPVGQKASRLPPNMQNLNST